MRHDPQNPPEHPFTIEGYYERGATGVSKWWRVLDEDGEPVQGHTAYADPCAADEAAYRLTHGLASDPLTCEMRRAKLYGIDP